MTFAAEIGQNVTAFVKRFSRTPLNLCNLFSFKVDAKTADESMTALMMACCLGGKNKF